ncbi:MAG: flippase [Anaerolineales bacterium]|nr:flippase [Anaerolineales bacterium]
MNTTPGSSSPRVISSTISLGVVSIFIMLLGLTGTILITRHFLAEEFGIYTLVMVFASFLSQISTFGLELSVSKFIAGAKDELSRQHFFSTAVIIRIVSILITSLLAWYGSPLIKTLFGQSLLPGFILYVPMLFAVESLRSLLRATLQGSFSFSKIGIADSFASSIYLILVIIIISINGDFTLLILARILSSFLACIFAFVSIPIRKYISFQMGAFKELMKFGYPLQINDILGFIYSRIDTIAVAVFFGPVDIATYEVARKIPDYLRNLYEPFKSVYYPVISKRYSLDEPHQAAAFMNDSIRFVAFVTLLGVVITTLFGKEILQFIFTQKYSSSAPIFVLLMLNLSIALISNVMGTTLVAVGDTQKPPIINFFNAIASWLGSILLIPTFGLVGASIANTFGTAIGFPLNRYFLRKRINLQDAPYLKPLILFCIWSALVFVIKPEFLIMKIAFLITFICACVFLSIVTKRDIAFLVDGSGISSWPPLHKFGLWLSRS